MKQGTFARLVLCVLPLALVGCVQFKSVMLSVEKKQVPVKLHKLDITQLPTQSLFVATIDKQAHELTLFRRELTTNLMDTAYKAPSYGTIRMVETASYTRSGKALTIASAVTLFSLNVLGMPLARLKVVGEYEFVINDLLGREIKRYTYTATAKQPIWIYYGKNQDVLKVEVVKDVLGQFGAELERDAPQINALLEQSKAEMDGATN